MDIHNNMEFKECINFSHHCHRAWFIHILKLPLPSASHKSTRESPPDIVHILAPKVIQRKGQELIFLILYSD